MAFEPGQKIGDYEIVARLGAGGLGVVYEVRHLISQRREAMKILQPEQGTPEMVERFRREVQTLATLNHVNIAQLHTAFYYGEQLAMIMELIHGETLRDFRLRTVITLPQTLDFIAQTLNALTYAHRLGVVHRDIKPSNIMIAEGELVKLLDFGIALTEHGSQLTRAGYLLGSLNYMSPEQLGGAKASARSDIYAVGVTLYELLTGTLPIKGASNYEIIMGHMHQAIVPPHQVADQVPIAVSAAVMRALAKDPAQRFATAEEFLYALRLTLGNSQQVRTFLAPALDTSSSSTPSPVSVARNTPPPMAATVANTPRSVAAPSSITQMATQPILSRSASSSGLENLSLDDISRKLAVYIGPVSRIVVKKLAEKSEDLDFIYREAAKHITSDADRAAFLRSRRQ